jgi:rhodanese-related sulfurtransferase
MDLWITPEELSRQINGENPPLVIDVRDAVDFQAGHIPGAVHIPWEQLRRRLEEIPRERPVVGY